MIRADKWKVTIIGAVGDILPEFGVLARALGDALKKAGVSTEEAKSQLIEMVNMAFEADSEEADIAEDTKKNPLDEVEDLLGKILETLKEGHK